MGGFTNLLTVGKSRYTQIFIGVTFLELIHMNINYRRLKKQSTVFGFE